MTEEQEFNLKLSLRARAAKIVALENELEAAYRFLPSAVRLRKSVALGLSIDHRTCGTNWPAQWRGAIVSMTDVRKNIYADSMPQLLLLMSEEVGR